MPGKGSPVFQQRRLAGQHVDSGARLSRFKSWLCHLLAWVYDSTYFVELLCGFNELGIDEMLKSSAWLSFEFIKCKLS